MASRTPLLVLGVLALPACNCGRQTLSQAEASLSLATAAVDFGAVPEGTTKRLTFRVDDVGGAPVNLVVALAQGSSGDFALGAVPALVEARGSVEVPVDFTPHRQGEDQGQVEVSSDQPGATPLTVALHGGPIRAVLAFEPNPLDFRPAAGSPVTKAVQVKSTGDAALTVSQVSLTASSNPDFALVPPTLPASLLPGEALGVEVVYSRSARGEVGLLEVHSNDAYAGTRTLQLLPDATGPGRDGGVLPDGGCDPDGLFTVDGGALSYACCGNLAVLNVSQVQLTAGGTVLLPGPTQPGTSLTSSAATTCPAGTFDASRTLAGTCSQTYRLQGAFTGPNTFTGTYTATYSGSTCGCGGGTPCVDQSFTFTAYR